MTHDNDKFIEYWKCLNQSAKIIKRKNLSEKDKIKINNLYEKADKLLLEINKKNLKSSYSTTGIIVGSISAAAITGAMLYYFNKKSLEKNVVDFSNLDTGSRIKKGEIVNASDDAVKVYFDAERGAKPSGRYRRCYRCDSKDHLVRECLLDRRGSRG